MQILARNLFRRLSSKHVTGRFAYSSVMAPDIGQPTPASHPHLMAEGELTPGIHVDEYIDRRKRLLELLPQNGLAIIASAPVMMMSDEVPYTFRQDPNYLYITGCQQPGGVAVLSHEHGLVMFMPESTPDDVAWSGQLAGVDAASNVFKAEQAFPKSKFREIILGMIRRSTNFYHNVRTATSNYVSLDMFQKAALEGKVKDISSLIHELRLTKSPAELVLMRESAATACQALLQTMLHSKGHPDERILSAKVEYECRVRGAQRMAFNPVVGGGPNASVIHYARNDQRIKDGDLVLLDMGCELHGYVSDLTRTWPPCGKFSSFQEELYNLILETNKECIKLCKPGTTIRQLNAYSTDMLCEGLMKMGILKNHRLYHQLNPTSIGHYLGMDVHDCSTVGCDRPLQPGFVITIEPGVYISSSFSCPERYKGIGIRIEDEVLITETGSEVLTGSMPKEIKHIEMMLNHYSHEKAAAGFVL